jgi:hypothetical protein
MQGDRHNQSYRNNSGLIWVIPSGTIMAYFCPPAITLTSFIFYILPILCGYFFLGRKAGSLLNQLEKINPIPRGSRQDALIWYKYGFGLILMIPLIIFSASPTPPDKVLAQFKAHELVSAQTAIWSIRNLFAMCVSALGLGIWSRYLHSIIRQENK